MKKYASPFYASILAAAVGASSIAMADQVADAKAEAKENGQNYFGVAGQVAKTDGDDYNSLSSSAIRLSVGRDIGSDLSTEERDLSGLISVEAHFAFGVDLMDDTSREIQSDANGKPVIVKSEAETDVVYGLYVRGNAPITEELSVYGLLGFGAAEISIDIGNESVDLDESGLSYGLGVQYDVNEELSIVLDYVGYDLHDDYKFSTYNAGVVYRF